MLYQQFTPPQHIPQVELPHTLSVHSRRNLNTNTSNIMQAFVIYTAQYSTEQYSTVQYSTVQHSNSTVQYSTVQYSTVQNSTEQYRGKG